MVASPHLLLVEDDEPLAGILSAHLRARGYEVSISPTAEDKPPAPQSVIAR